MNTINDLGKHKSPNETYSSVALKAQPSRLRKLLNESHGRNPQGLRQKSHFKLSKQSVFATSNDTAAFSYSITAEVPQTKFRKNGQLKLNEQRAASRLRKAK